MNKNRIAIFASGTGSNAVNLIRNFKQNESMDVAFVLSNKSTAQVLVSSKELGIKTYSYSNEEVSDGQFLLDLCSSENIDWVVLAGYLRKIPNDFTLGYANKIINLHPSLLPKFGGKGMYGSHVHKAVIEAKEIRSGITVHLVNEEFDKGEILAQFTCPLSSLDTVESLAYKIHQLEQAYLPIVVETTIKQRS
ncbi:MAG: phosphoribosylglycinamide formyltransferase [Crocinitomicaceae bacterium]|nr:phosphoribosylglycinamide formyltransferase [Crocinitomicaceae bacterium]